MISYTTLSAAFIIAITSTQAAAHFVGEVHQLFSRQSAGAGIGLDPNDIPPACKDTCLALNDVLGGTCATLDCICGSRISSSMSGCLQCAIDVSGLSSFESQAQSVYDNYANSCRSAGMTVPSFTFKLNSGSSGAGGSSGNTGSTGNTGSSGGNNGGIHLNAALRPYVGTAGLAGAVAAAFVLGV